MNLPLKYLSLPPLDKKFDSQHYVLFPIGAGDQVVLMCYELEVDKVFKVCRRSRLVHYYPFCVEGNYLFTNFGISVFACRVFDMSLFQGLAPFYGKVEGLPGHFFPPQYHGHSPMPL